MKTFKIAVLVLFITAPLLSMSQVNFGFKGGLNFPSLNEVNGTWDSNSYTGWHAGVMTEIRADVLGVQGEMLYSKTGYTVVGFGDITNSYLDIPVVAKLHILDILSIHAGPQFSYLIESESSVWGKFKNDIDDRNYKIVAGAGLTLGNFDLHGRFIFPSKTTFKDANETYRDKNFQISAGLWF